MIASMSAAFAKEMQGVEAELRIALEACRQRKRRRRPRGPSGRRRYRTGEAMALLLGRILGLQGRYEFGGGLGSGTSPTRDPSSPGVGGF